MMPSKLDAAAALESMDALQSKPLTTVPDEMRPAFDYSQLDEQTAQTLQNYSFRALQVARTYYRDLMEIVVGAHKLLCGTVVPVGDNGRFVAKEDTFRAWCASVHISKTKAYQLLQIQDFMDNCTPEQQSTLALLPFTAMRELVTGDTPEQVITMAKDGKVSTSKEVLELKAQLKAEKERADAAETRLKNSCIAEQNAWEAMQKAENARDAALADVQGLTEQNAKLQQSYHDADESRIAANLQRQKAETERDRAEERAKNAEDALKKQPITAVVDKEEVTRQARKLFADMADEEVDRRAHQQAYSIAADMTEELKADKARLQKNMDELKQQLAEAQAVVPADLIADKEIADSCYLNIDGIWGMALPSFQRLVGTGEDFNHAAGNLLQLCDHIHEELVKMTIANDKETLYD